MRNKILHFRAWDGLDKKFTYWSMNDLCTWAEKDIKPSPFDLWQRDTGLLDCNGTPIFEGDIVEYAENNLFGGGTVDRGQVVYDEWMARYHFEDSGGSWDPLYTWNGSQMLDDKGHDGGSFLLRVIGNVKENPELLK